MIFPITSAIVLVQWLLLVEPASVDAQSPTPACYTCPLTNGFNEKLELEVPDDTNFLCLYLSNDCFYDNDGTLLNNEPGCPLEAVNDCVVRRELARQRALPRSPRPPSPGAFAAKPKVMHVRADLGYSKKQRAAKRDMP
ncbi:hypothetical protein BKA70DRAFT_1398630 [Coprinopsis sp. MPI-PUGE-AT-0042]|nr:hypothetical protein BKA70DRAFT_1398630 [Coprinopsis sp. MPI-PUGE-AT-0042]